MTMPNVTARKFGHPATLVSALAHWLVLLRPAQPTLGSLVLVCTDEARRFSDVTPAAFAELATATRQIETGLAAFRPFDRINYLMLMMVDPDVHFHVIPRYAEVQEFDGVAYPDAGWPGPPVLGAAVTPDNGQRGRLLAALKAGWKA